MQTKLQLYYKSHLPLRSTSTLQQNEITQNCTLIGKIHSSNLQFTSSSNSSLLSENKLSDPGISLLLQCRNQSCFNYKKQFITNLGYGKFDIEQIVNQQLQCNMCSSKYTKLYSVKCKEVMVKRCVYMIKVVKSMNGNIFQQEKGKSIKVLNQRKIKKDLQIKQDQIGKIIQVVKL